MRDPKRPSPGAVAAAESCAAVLPLASFAAIGYESDGAKWAVVFAAIIERFAVAPAVEDAKVLRALKESAERERDAAEARAGRLAEALKRCADLLAKGTSALDSAGIAAVEAARAALAEEGKP